MPQPEGETTPGPKPPAEPQLRLEYSMREDDGKLLLCAHTTTEISLTPGEPGCQPRANLGQVMKVVDFVHDCWAGVMGPDVPNAFNVVAEQGATFVTSCRKPFRYCLGPCPLGLVDLCTLAGMVAFLNTEIAAAMEVKG